MKYIFLLITLFCLNFVSCQIANLKPTNNIGGYTVEIVKATEKSKDSVVLMGNVYDVRNQKPLFAMLKYGCDEFKTNEDGSYSLKTKKVGWNTHLEAVWVGFRNIQTEYFMTKDIDTVKINIYMGEDDRIIPPCVEGIH